MKHRFESLSVWEKINIIRFSPNDIYPSQVLDIIKADEIIVRGPIRKSNIILMNMNEPIKILYYVENRGKFLFTGEIISRKFTPIYSLTIQKKSKTNIIQLREFYRLPIAIKITKRHEVKKYKEIKVIEEECEAKDISGGGMRVFCNYKHKLGDKIICSFNIYDDLLELTGSVTRINEIDSFHYKYSIGVSFVEITEENRDLIIRYIFEHQRILRGKGLI